MSCKAAKRARLPVLVKNYKTMSNERIYTVFVRNWYKADGKTPNPQARKTVLRRNLTREEAYNACQEYNRSNNPGKRSRKAEFTSNF